MDKSKDEIRRAFLMGQLVARLEYAILVEWELGRSVAEISDYLQVPPYLVDAIIEELRRRGFVEPEKGDRRWKMRP